MPSIITHDTFGREVYSVHNKLIGQSEDEKQAFLLGCQGPDVFFFGSINPLALSANKFGKKLHRAECTMHLSLLIAASAYIKDGPSSFENDLHRQLEKLRLKTLSSTAQDVARAYCLGFLCHHTLDSFMHPFVFAQQYALCNAGIDGLDKDSESEVHAEIECELDELVLSVKRGETIASFDPSARILCGSNRILEVVSLLFDISIPLTYHQVPPANMFKYSIKAYRQTERALYSTSGIKRNMVGQLERTIRKHSYLRAITHKNHFITESIFDNHEHNIWKNPWEQKSSTQSFWDIYEDCLAFSKNAIKSVSQVFSPLSSENFVKQSSVSRVSTEELSSIIHEVSKATRYENFYGCPEKIADPQTGKPKKINV